MWCLASISTPLIASDWYVEKSLSFSSSARLHGEDKLTTQVNSLGLKAEYNRGIFLINFDSQLQYDAVYDFHNGYSGEAQDEYGTRLWVDEAYIGITAQAWDFSLGYQKVVWGAADDLRLVDVINPLDLKDFVLFDIDEYRISVPMFKAETSTENGWDLELIYLFDFQKNQLPEVGSEFSIVGISGLTSEQPDGGEFGFSAASFIFDADVDFYAFNGYHDNPVLTTQHQDIILTHKRETMLGTSISRPVGDWVVRSEIALIIDRSHTLENFQLAKSNVWQGLLGFDYLYGDWLFTMQLSDSQIQDWQNNYLSDNKHAPVYTLSADVNLLAGKLTTRFSMSYADSNGGGGLYQTKLTYVENEHWKVQLNLDVLGGNTGNFFGTYRKKDRIWLATTYTF